jgi:hypothetical protein
MPIRAAGEAIERWGDPSAKRWACRGKKEALAEALWLTPAVREGTVRAESLAQGRRAPEIVEREGYEKLTISVAICGNHDTLPPSRRPCRAGRRQIAAEGRPQPLWRPRKSHCSASLAASPRISTISKCARLMTICSISGLACPGATRNHLARERTSS